jgi:ATP-binding cassette subfamily C protein PrsD
MSVLRVFSLGLILAAVAVAVFDATRSAESWSVTATRFDEAWAYVHAQSLATLQTAVHRHLPVLGDPGFQTLLRLPAWLVLVLLGICLSLFGRRRQTEKEPAAGESVTPSAALLRGLGLGFLIASAAAVILSLSQGSAPHAGGAFATLGDLWQQLHPGSLDVTTATVKEHAPDVWDPWLLTMLRLPALLIVVLVGFGLYRMGAKRRTAAIKGGAAAAEAQGSEASSPQASSPQASPRSELAHALSSCRSAFVSVGLFSGVSNVLMLTGAFFMLQIYDRILPSRSVPTLVALAVLVGVLFAFLAIIDMIRSRLLIRIGGSLDNALSARVYDTIVRVPLRVGGRGDGLQPLRDLDSVRAFLSGPGPTALFDLPWLPLYLAIIFSFHTALGITALIGAMILITLTLFTEAFARQPMKAASGFAATRNGLAEASRRNAEVLAAMGMAGRLNARWSEANQSYLSSHQKVSDVTGGFGSFSKALRMMLQSAVLGIGAYLVILQAATAGIIIAAAILVARALAPVDLAIANWKGFLAARQGWKRLTQLLELLPAHETPMALPAPSASLVVEHVSAVPPGERKVVVQDVNFTLASGQGVGIIGPSASGKSSLVRMIVGAWVPARGKVRLDGAALDQWSPDALGAHIGYLPQDVELFSGTVAENIARFELDANAEAIIEASRAAGVHDLIVALPQGYETEIGEQGQVLSAGQRQRIALARALYREPFLVVLDEPNSNLDSEGEAALTQAIMGVRQRGGILIVVAHRPSALAAVDLVLVMANGSAVSFGPKDEVLSKVLAQKPAAQRPPLSVVAETGGTKT